MSGAREQVLAWLAGSPWTAAGGLATSAAGVLGWITWFLRRRRVALPAPAAAAVPVVLRAAPEAGPGVSPEGRPEGGSEAGPVSAPAAGLAVPPGAVVVDFRWPAVPAGLAAAFRRGLGEARGRRGGARRPWILLLAEEGTEAGLLLGTCGLDLAAGPPEAESAEAAGGCSWWSFDRGAVLEVAPGVGAPGAAGGGFRALLSLLRAARPERPLDGVLLVLRGAPAGDLPGDVGPRAAAAALRGRAWRGRLRQVQERLGLSLPVYVLMAGGERLPGFAGFAAALGPARRRGLLGWSPPHPLSLAFHPGWVDDAFADLAAGLEQAQLAAFGAAARPVDADGVFRFPLELGRLRPELRALLSGLFQAEPGPDPALWRGLYVCGLDCGEALFVHDLLAEKAFAECLAAPTAAARRAGGRAARAARALLAVLLFAASFGVGWGAFGLGERARALAPFLARTAEDLEQLRRARRAGQPVPPGFARDASLRLLAGLAAVDDRRFASVFLPPSWLGGFGRDLDRALGQAVDEILFRSLGAELRERAGRLAGGGPPDPAPARPAGFAPAAFTAAVDEAAGQAGAAATAEPPAAPLPVAGLPELLALRRLTAGLDALEARAGDYAGLGSAADLAGLDALLRDLFGSPLPRRLQDHPAAFQRARSRVAYPPFDPAAYRPGAQGRVRQLVAGLHRRLFRDNVLHAHLLWTARALDDLAGAGPEAGDPAPRLRRLHGLLAGLDRQLASPDLAWVSAPRFTPGPAFEEALTTVGRSAFLGPALEQELRQDGDRALAALQAELLGVEAPFTGPLLGRGPDGRLRLSPAARLLEQALAELLGESFMRPPGEPWGEPLPGGRLVWDTGRLEEALALAAPYDAVARRLRRELPGGLAEALAAAARERLGAALAERIAAAQLPAPAGSLPDEPAASLEAAGRPLAQLLETLRRLGLGAGRARLAARITAQAGELLREADRRLAAGDPYAPKRGGFGLWGGERPAALEAYGIRDAAELTALLAAERSRLAGLATRTAGPVLAALEATGLAGAPGVAEPAGRWQGIVRELAAQRDKKPGNSVAELEAFFTGPLSEVRPADCSPAAPAGGGDSDFFLARRDELAGRLFARCRELAAARAVAGYGGMARFFNERLAGRFPFSPGVPERGAREAEPADVRAFFRLYDPTAPYLPALPLDPRPEGPGREVRAFLDGMARVRRLFAAFLADPRPDAAPTFALDVEFRQNRGDERHGDHVLRWELASGARRAVHPAARRGPALLWTAGMPVQVRLHWAKDGPLAPCACPPRPRQRVTGQTVSFDYAGRWALFALLREQAAGQAEAAGVPEPRPHLLRLRVGAQPAGLEAPPAEAWLYLRVGLAPPPPEGQEAAPRPALAVPAAFPVVAPPLERQGGLP